MTLKVSTASETV